MIASLKSERLKTPNEGSKPEFHLRWIRELVPINDRYLSGLPEAEMRDAQVSVVGAVSIGSFELSR